MNSELYLGFFDNSLELLLLAVLLTVLFAIYLFVKLLRVQQKLRSGFQGELKGRRSSVDFYLDKIKKQKSILDIDVLNREIATSHELSLVLNKIAEATKDIFNCQSVEISLVDTATEEYKSTALAGKKSEVLGHEKREQRQIKPILFAGERFGIFVLEFDSNYRFTVEDDQLFDLLVKQTAVAVLNAKYVEQLVQLKKQVEETNKAKIGFLANISHEIRGPLGTIMNAVEIVMAKMLGEINEQQESTLQMVKSNGDHLLDLITDVLDYAKIEAGKNVPNTKFLSASVMVDDVGKLVNSQAVKKKHKFRYAAKDEDLVFQADRRHVRQILINFLTNAIKYTPDGGEINFWVEKYRNNQLRFVVQDNGVGVKEEDQHKLFSEFERMDDEYSQQQRGTGLGLSLAVKLAETNGGKISFSSVFGEGSEFYLYFDLSKKSISEMEALGQFDDDYQKGKGETILLFETNYQEAQLTIAFLENIGYKVKHLTSFNFDEIPKSDSEASDIKYSLALVENSLLDLSEKPVLTDLKQYLGPDPLPVIVLSSRAFDFDTEAYMKLGADLCMTKPVSFSELAAAIRENIDK